jgi:hypothetical protein
MSWRESAGAWQSKAADAHRGQQRSVHMSPASSTPGMSGVVSSPRGHPRGMDATAEMTPGGANGGGGGGFVPRRVLTEERRAMRFQTATPTQHQQPRQYDAAAMPAASPAGAASADERWVTIRNVAAADVGRVRVWANHKFGAVLGYRWSQPDLLHMGFADALHAAEAVHVGKFAAAETTCDAVAIGWCRHVDVPPPAGIDGAPLPGGAPDARLRSESWLDYAWRGARRDGPAVLAVLLLAFVLGWAAAAVAVALLCALVFVLSRV